MFGDPNIYETRWWAATCTHVSPESEPPGLGERFNENRTAV